MDWTTIIALVANWMAFILLLVIIYKFTKKMFKKWMYEALHEYEKDEVLRKAVSRAEGVRAKYG